MNILVRYHGVFAQIAACREERLELAEEATIRDALKGIARRHPPLAEAMFLRSGEPAPYARPVLNGILLKPEDLARRLLDGDMLALLPATSGG